jgi:hypothetical protein
VRWLFPRHKPHTHHPQSTRWDRPTPDLTQTKRPPAVVHFSTFLRPPSHFTQHQYQSHSYQSSKSYTNMVLLPCSFPFCPSSRMMSSFLYNPTSFRKSRLRLPLAPVSFFPLSFRPQCWTFSCAAATPARRGTLVLRGGRRRGGREAVVLIHWVSEVRDVFCHLY